jgi:hypothetical protein
MLSSDDDEGEDQLEDGAGVAGGVLRRSHSVAYSRSASFVASPTAPSTVSTMVRQFVVTLLATLASWNLPRYLIAHETFIATKPVPYQVVGSDNLVVLNPELHQPLVDPPTIPCTCAQ